MLKGISPAISPCLLKAMAEMGHGDEIVISDAHFPAHTFNANVIRADGVSAEAILAGMIPLFELDAYAIPVVMMAAVPGDSLDPKVEESYRQALGYRGEIERMERFAFYERAKKAFAVVITGQTAMMYFRFIIDYMNSKKYYRVILSEYQNHRSSIFII